MNLEESLMDNTSLVSLGDLSTLRLDVLSRSRIQTKLDENRASSEIVEPLPVLLLVLKYVSLHSLSHTHAFNADA